MNRPLKRIFFGFIVFFTTIATAVMGYRIGGCGWLESVYMVVITVFGVGYGEVCPSTTPAHKIFTIVVIVAGTSSVVYIVGAFIQMVTEGDLQNALGVRRMTKGIESLEHHAIICGYGRIGQVLARKLEDNNIPFVVIDHDVERTKYAEEHEIGRAHV